MTHTDSKYETCWALIKQRPRRSKGNGPALKAVVLKTKTKTSVAPDRAQGQADARGRSEEPLPCPQLNGFHVVRKMLLKTGDRGLLVEVSDVAYFFQIIISLSVYHLIIELMKEKLLFDYKYIIMDLECENNETIGV